jgi:cytochrome c oxidase assembly protein subunit 15
MISIPDASMTAPSRSPALEGGSRSVCLWLFVVAGFVFMMVVVGGATRLTGSGLSITEWKPVTGAIPPLDEAAWRSAFDKYRASSQYHLINQGITLANFKVLYWWEWAHRLLGRWVGVVYAAPFIAFLALRRLPRPLIGRCYLLLGLGGLQGLVGWWMVESGLEGRASVAPERLLAHLGLALLLLAALVWTALDAGFGMDRPAGRSRPNAWGLAAFGFVGFVFIQCLLGALVAGNAAGLVDNDWPLMGGRVFPDGYWQTDLWTTLAHGRPSVQFNHRLVAYGLLAYGMGLAFVAVRRRPGSVAVTRLAILCAVLLLVQAGLGIAALWLGDPLALALAHQANAALVLAFSTALAWRSQRGMRYLHTL